ncbi:MAG: class I SAM-dependent methyltransferase [Nitrospirae bacterium]|nr:class I SAM-dependent methyltransferase [Nitrospirota bacterium]
MKSKINYNEIAKDYLRYRSVSPTIIAHIIENTPASKIKKILEIGCGTADHLYCLHEQWNGCEAYGFDNSFQMINEGASKHPGLLLEVSDIENAFPYSDKFFDFVFSINVIHYVKDLMHCFNELNRVLDNDGIVLTVTDSEDDIRNRTMSKYFLESIEIELRRYPSMDSIIKEMKSAGFKDMQVKHTEYKRLLTTEDLEKYKNKAYSALRLVSQECFNKGIKDMISDVENGAGELVEVYTYVWGKK